MIGGYFLPEDRNKIASMWEGYQPVAVIACALMVDPSTIHRELKLGNMDGALDANKRLKYDPASHSSVFTKTCADEAGKRRQPHDCDHINSAGFATAGVQKR